LASNTRVGIDSLWRNTISIESLGQGKRFGTLSRIMFEDLFL